MAADQDWCLECGTAAPGRLGGRPRWRLGAAVLSLSLLLIGSAAVAGYAAVTSDAERETTAQNIAPGTPAPGAAVTPPVPERPTSQPPKVETPTTETTAPSTTDPSSVAPVDPVTPVDPVEPVEPITPDTTTDPTTDTETDPPAPAEPALTSFKLRSGDVEIYDPYERPGAEFGDPKDALTKSREFDVTVPADGEEIGAGLLVDLGAVRTVREVRFRTDTRRMGLEVYGVKTGKPGGLRAGWRLLEEPDLAVDGLRDVTVTLEKPAEIRRLVLWFTSPSSTADPRAALGRLDVLG